MTIKTSLWLALALCGSSCGGALRGGAIGGGVSVSPDPTYTIGVVACAVQVAQTAPCPRPIAGATIEIQHSDGWVSKIGNGDGYAVMYASIPFSAIRISAAGYVTHAWSIEPPKLDRQNVTFSLEAEHVDPSTIPLEQLAAIRGSMWPTRINVPYGPRPNQDTNILATDFYGLYDASTQKRMLDVYQARGYTHAVTGPVAGSDCYHGLYPCRTALPTQPQWDAFLDDMQAWWDRGIVPVYFHKPDGWETPDHAADLAAMDALAAQPRAQKLLRVVVYCGWEPSGSKYGWKNRTYVACLQRGAAVFPAALRALHTVADLDAPTGGDDDHEFPVGQGNAISWQNAAPYIHLWLVQVGGYVDGCCEVPTPDFIVEFKKLWPDFLAKFAGAAGWPTSSAWGPGRPVRAIYAEGASYGDFWKNWDERYALDLGDLAIAAGAWGYLDGGRVAVPVVR